MAIGIFSSFIFNNAIFNTDGGAPAVVAVDQAPQYNLQTFGLRPQRHQTYIPGNERFIGEPYSVFMARQERARIRQQNELITRLVVIAVTSEILQ